MRAIPMALLGFLATATACEVPSATDTELAPSMAIGPAAHVIRGAGHVTIADELRSFSLSAQIAADGIATGQFELHSRQADVRVHGEIVCATTFGGTAWLGGTITTAGPFEGQDAIWRVADFGAGQKGFPDLISLLQPNPPGTAQRYCDAAPFFPPLSLEVDGGITVSSPGQSSFTTIDVVEVDFPVFVPCAADGAGELVLLQGPLQFLFHVNEDPAGGFHLTSEANPQGLSGYGQTTGDQYQGTGGTGGHFNSSFSGFPYTDSYVNNFRIIGQGTGNDLLIHENVHFTINANGEVTATVGNFSAECR